ncbi:MAG TPA: hydantoinase/oxoprolinase family protein [Patescibacteria group bacterium]|nr:hydantoinase/oxoprolinase family protein [Patescibacteria group bacterium]
MAGSDIGGTFTDVTVLDGDRLTIRKVPSTPPTFDVGASEGMDRAIREAGVAPERVEAMLHATTVATNAILEGRGARTGLLTTDGFRDVLELRRARSPELYDLFYRPPLPLVERRLRRGVSERIGPRGEVLTPIDSASVERAVAELARAEVEAVAICFLHAYRNGAHERLAAQLTRAGMPFAFITTSSEVLPEIGEYERTSTTVINAYLGPIVAAYLARMRTNLEAKGHRAPIFVMQSNGALMDLEVAARQPARMVESGPAAGVIGAMTLAVEQGVGDAITFDMGGTTTKAGLIEDGRPLLTADYEVGAGLSSTTGHGSGRGHALRLPVLDIAEVGAGGGSLVQVDDIGRLTVGPRSAGADPGPACYGLGGRDPTLTDALVVLGWINPDILAGGLVELHADRARSAIGERVAARLGLTVEAAAEGALRVALAETARAVKHVTTFRGRRPNDFALIAYGGNGPVIGAALADELGIERVIVPPGAGVFSSFGLLQAEEAHHFGRPAVGAAAASVGLLDAAFRELEADAAAFARVRGGGTGWTRQRMVDMRYRDQRAVIQVAVGDVATDRPWIDSVRATFAAEHERTFGYRAADEDIELVNLRLVVSRQRSTTRTARIAPAPAPGPRATQRRLRFGSLGWQDVPVVSRSAIGRGRPGPLVIDEYDATIVVPPRWLSRLDPHGNLVLGKRAS